jgi:hypothetical protein
MTTLNYYRGDTWQGITFTTTWNGGLPPNPAASARMQFRLQGTGGVDTVVQLLSTGVSPKLTIDDAAAWTIIAEPHILPISIPGNWYFDLEITDTSGNVHTTAKGILLVEPDITRDMV